MPGLQGMAPKVQISTQESPPTVRVLGLVGNAPWITGSDQQPDQTIHVVGESRTIRAIGG